MVMAPRFVKALPASSETPTYTVKSVGRLLCLSGRCKQVAHVVERCLADAREIQEPAKAGLPVNAADRADYLAPCTTELGQLLRLW